MTAYHLWLPSLLTFCFGFCEFLNMAMVIVFLFITAGGICEDLTEKECGIAAGIVDNVELEAKANGHNQESYCR